MEELSLFTLESLARTGVQEQTRLPVLFAGASGCGALQAEGIHWIAAGRPEKTHLKPILRSVFNNLNACIKKPSRQVRVVKVTANTSRC